MIKTLAMFEKLIKTQNKIRIDVIANLKTFLIRMFIRFKHLKRVNHVFKNRFWNTKIFYLFKTKTFYEEMEDEKMEWFRRYQKSGSDTTWRTLGTKHSTSSVWIWTPDGELDGLKGRTKVAKGLRYSWLQWCLIWLTRPPNKGSLVVAWYDSQVQRFEEVFTWIWLTKKQDKFLQRTKSFNSENSRKNWFLYFVALRHYL